MPLPPQPPITGARSLVRNGQMQNDLDAQGYRIMNLDTSNLSIPGIPSQAAQANKWFNSWDGGALTFGVAQPAFTNLSGNLTFAQQTSITRLGLISIGTWRATPIEPGFAPRLDLIRPPLHSVNILRQKITNLADPADNLDAVNYQTLVLIAQSPVNPKPAVNAASTANLVPSTLLHPIDGVTLNDGDRVLVKNQSAGREYQNGIWIAHTGSWTRADDFDGVPDPNEVLGASCFVLGGTVNIGTTWLMTTPAPIVIGTTPIIWQLLTATLSLNAGNGLSISGNTISAVGTANRISVGTGIDIASNYSGQTSISAVGTLTTGDWQADVIDGAYGGTGVANTNKRITLAGDLSTSLGLGAPIGSYLTFSLVASTTLTLPFTGTVATLAGNETFSNKHISADQIDSGILPVNRGGTGGDTRQLAMTNLLPSQVGHAGESLFTDGAGNLSWGSPVPGGGG